MTRLYPIRNSIAIFAAALTLAVLTICLPTNTYQRWQQLHDTIYDQTRWIYERCRFDPTPIDVAIIGSSRTRQAVNARQLQAELSRDNLPLNVVNFSVLSPGRGTDYAIIDLLLKYKKPKLLIVDILENPDRNVHPAYKYLASTKTIVWPTFGRGLGYFSDILFLPYREGYLFFANILPDEFKLKKRFDPQRYAGPVVDTTGTVAVAGTVNIQAEKPATLSQLRREADKFEAENAYRARYPRVVVDYVNADERRYVESITRLARARGVKIAFLFLPRFGGPGRVAYPSIYRGLGPIWNANFVAGHPAWFGDFVHLTRAGAYNVTTWLATPIAAEMASEYPSA